MITQSTTTELLRMYYKLREFFSQQLHSGRIVISSLQHDGGGVGASGRRVTSMNEHLQSTSPASFGRKISVTPVKPVVGSARKDGVGRTPAEGVITFVYKLISFH